MCGIIGYTGQKNAREVVLNGLELLEYRGYDSAGYATNDGAIHIVKNKGRVAALARLPYPVDAESLKPLGDAPHTAIGHTRWATHGEPSAKNAHPHLSFDGRVAICHNGIIENYLELKDELKSFGINFVSDTDSELIAHLIALNLKNNLRHAVEAAMSRVSGSCTILSTSVVNPEEIVAYRKRASLIVGLGEDENLVASDVLALSAYTTRAVVLQDDELAVLTPTSVKFFRDKIEIEKTAVTLDIQKIEPLDCHMQNEILEIPCALKRTLNSFENTDFSELFSTPFEKVILVGCGTAYHAALYGKHCFEEIANIPCEPHIASEFSNCRFIDWKTLAVFISQSGETADTLLALKRAKENGAKTLALTNVKNSSLSYEADFTLYLNCGAEIAVAATKSYNSQLLALYLIAHKLAKKAVNEQTVFDMINECNLMCNKASPFLFESRRKFFFIGRGTDYITAKEGALKFKEITYFMTDAQPAGELKHGTIALIDKQSLVVAVLTDEAEKNKMQTTLNELKSRGASTIVLTNSDCEGDITIKLPKHGDNLLSAVSAVIPLQQLALATSKSLGLDPDKPRNLAKSVTVD